MLYIPDVDDADNKQLIQGGPTITRQPRRNEYPSSSNPPPNFSGRPKWVAVSTLTREVVDPNVKQPDPDRIVLCACINKYGCIAYGYYDEIPRWHRILLVFAVVFAIFATPLSLLCFIPALQYMKKVSDDNTVNMCMTAINDNVIVPLLGEFLNYVIIIL